MFSLFLSQALTMPLPPRYPGIAFNKTDGLVLYELFCCPLCPDCRTFWPKAEQIMNTFGNNIQFIYHFVPLPFHTWAFSVVKTILAVNSINNQAAQTLIHWFYSEDQDNFSNQKLQNNTASQVKTTLLQYASSKTGISYEKLNSIFDDFEDQARLEFKFACEHSISGTPTSVLNGVPKSYDPETDVQTIIDYIKTLIP